MPKGGVFTSPPNGNREPIPPHVNGEKEDLVENPAFAKCFFKIVWDVYGT